MAEFDGDANSSTEKLPLSKVLVKLEQIRDGLREVKEDLHDSIAVFEGEPLEKLRSEAEVKAETLEEEVKRLREELRQIKDLLGANLEKKKPKEN